MGVMLDTSIIVDFFHSFPHVDFNFYNTTLIFTPDDSRYQQALLFNGIYLLFATVIFFLLFGIYFLVCSCYFCAKCRPQSLKPRPTRSRCLRLLIGFLAICSCFTLGISFYANNKTHDGVGKLATASENIYLDFDTYKFKNNVISRFVTLSIKDGVVPLQNALSIEGFNISLPLLNLSNMLTSVDDLLKKNGNILKDADIDLKSVSKDFIDYDNIRWWVTLCILLWQLLSVLVILYSAFSKRRSPFILLTIMTIVCLFLMMASVSFEVPLSIGGADLCKQPRKSLLQYVKKQPAKGLVLFYLDCTNSTLNNPLRQPYTTVDKDLSATQTFLNRLDDDPIIQALNSSEVYLEIMRNTISNSREVLSQLMDLIGCQDINDQFYDGVDAVCNITLDGLGLLILTNLITSLLLIFVLLCVTPIWKAMAPLRPILKRDKVGVHLITDSYQGPPGGSESFHGSSSFDVSYKSIDDTEFEHLPLITGKHDRPPSYRAIHGSTEFLSVEEEDRRNNKSDG